MCGLYHACDQKSQTTLHPPVLIPNTKDGNEDPHMILYMAIHNYRVEIYNFMARFKVQGF